MVEALLLRSFHIMTIKNQRRIWIDMKPSAFLLILGLTVMLGACDQSRMRMNQVEKFDEHKLDFTCVHEADHWPAVDPEADQIFKYARYLEKKSPRDFNDIGRLYRIAAAQGHFKAIQNLQGGIYRGDFSSDNAEKEVVDLNEELIKMNLGFGYYNMGTLIEQGFGLKQDKLIAMSYYRKAADLGNPNGQSTVGEYLTYDLRRPEIGEKMLTCSADQGFADAAFTLGMFYQNYNDETQKNNYSKALFYYQLAASLGKETPPLGLSEAFKAPPATDRAYYMGIDKPDPERTRRYMAIWKNINQNPDARFPDIDKIVPLPPAPLPEWDGTFQWEKDQAKEVPVPKPTDDLIKRLAEAKGLDPATGLPKVPEPPKPVKVSTSKPPFKPTNVPIGHTAKSGETCPQSGVWLAHPLAYCSDKSLSFLMASNNKDQQQRFKQGDTLPTLTVRHPRRWIELDALFGMRYRTIPVAWKLVEFTAERNV